MTNDQLDLDRVKIVKEYLATGEILNLSGDLDISISSSTPGIYHVFFDRQTKHINKNNHLTHQYSMSDVGLKNMVDNLEIDTIKRIFVESRILKLRNRKVLENEINPLDLEQSI